MQESIQNHSGQRCFSELVELMAQARVLRDELDEALGQLENDPGPIPPHLLWAAQRGEDPTSGGIARCGSTTVTSREIEVLRLVSSGMSNRCIARELGISEKTVKNHLSSTFVKLDVRSRVEAVVRAGVLGLVPPLGVPVPS